MRLTFVSQWQQVCGQPTPIAQKRTRNWRTHIAWRLWNIKAGTSLEREVQLIVLESHWTWLVWIALGHSLCQEKESWWYVSILLCSYSFYRTSWKVLSNGKSIKSSGRNAPTRAWSHSRPTWSRLARSSTISIASSTRVLVWKSGDWPLSHSRSIGRILICTQVRLECYFNRWFSWLVDLKRAERVARLRKSRLVRRMAPKIMKAPLTAKILHLTKDGEVTDLTPKNEKPTVWSLNDNSLISLSSFSSFFSHSLACWSRRTGGPNWGASLQRGWTLVFHEKFWKIRRISFWPSEFTRNVWILAMLSPFVYWIGNVAKNLLARESTKKNGATL